jgi:hypothetical protein
MGKPHIAASDELTLRSVVNAESCHSETLRVEDDVTALPRKIHCLGPLGALASSSPQRQAKAVTMDPRTIGVETGVAVATEEYTS